MVGVEQGPLFARPQLEEAQACLFGITCAIQMGIENLVIEGDYLPLINMLEAKQHMIAL